MSRMVVTFRRQRARKKGHFLVVVLALLRQHGRVCQVISPLLCLPCRQHPFQIRGTLRAVQTRSIFPVTAIPMVIPPSGLRIILLLRPWMNAQTLVYRFKGGMGHPHHHRTILGAPSEHGVWTQARRSLHPQPLTKLVGTRLSLMRYLQKPHPFLNRINLKRILGHKHSLTNRPPPLHPQRHAPMASASRLPHASTCQMAYSPPHLRQLS